MKIQNGSRSLAFKVTLAAAFILSTVIVPVKGLVSEGAFAAGACEWEALG